MCLNWTHNEQINTFTRMLSQILPSEGIRQMFRKNNHNLQNVLVIRPFLFAGHSLQVHISVNQI